MTQNKPLLIFDFDGTIADSLTLGLKLVNQLAHKYKYSEIESLSEIRKKSGVQFIKSHVRWYRIPFWIQDLKKMVMNNIDEIVIYPNIPHVLKKLSLTTELAIIGGGPNGYHDYLLDKFSLNYFSIIFPNRIYRKERDIKKIKKRYSNRKIYYIGDDIEDIKSANKMDLISIAVTWGTTDSNLFKEYDPDYIINNPEELISIVERSI